MFHCLSIILTIAAVLLGPLVCRTSGTDTVSFPGAVCESGVDNSCTSNECPHNDRERPGEDCCYLGCVCNAMADVSIKVTTLGLFQTLLDNAFAQHVNDGQEAVVLVRAGISDRSATHPTLDTGAAVRVAFASLII